MGKTPEIDNQETEPLNKDDQDEEESKEETENIASDKVSFKFYSCFSYFDFRLKSLSALRLCQLTICAVLYGI